jgi:hypothetical protein
MSDYRGYAMALAEEVDRRAAVARTKDAEIARLTELVKRGRKFAQYVADDEDCYYPDGSVIRDARTHLDATKEFAE